MFQIFLFTRQYVYLFASGVLAGFVSILPAYSSDQPFYGISDSMWS